jgi:DNA replication and repair protein RecF
MLVKNLSLVSFRNYQELSLKLHPKLNCFVGDNGVGKTNLLDSVYYLCMCKSYFNSNDLYSIRKDDDFMVLQAEVNREEKQEELYCALKRGNKKQFRRNKKEYGKLSDHVGLFPVVMVSPSDMQLITEASEERRKYINSVISQYDRAYLECMIQYNHILAQRNKFLKDSHERRSEDDLLEILDDQLIKAGEYIFTKRKSFIENFIPVFSDYYHSISGGHENIELIYSSQLNEGTFSDMLSGARTRDRHIQYTSVGIHKDDLILNLEGRSIKHIGSQGQLKTFLVSLKFAQFEFLRRLKNIPPLLLLDDVFDKLDSKRVRNILQLVHNESFGQIFITHTSQEGMKAILSDLQVDHFLFRVTEGAVERINEIKDIKN